MAAPRSVLIAYEMTLPPDLQRVLHGQLLHLRPLRSDDFDALFAVTADPLIWEQHPARDRYQPEVFRAFFDEAMASGGALSQRTRGTARSSAARATMATTPSIERSKSGGRFWLGRTGAGNTTAK